MTITDQIRELYGEAVFKTEDGRKFHAGDYAYVGDPQKPTTWKLRLTGTPGAKPDAKHVGMAVAALGKGFRGNKVQLPAGAVGKVKAKLRSAWRSTHESGELPEVLKAAAYDEPLANPLSLMGLGITLPEMVFEDEAIDHPNKTLFEGVLTRLDEPSTRPPSGSEGHRVLMPRIVAEQALPSLIGMGVNAAMGLRDHDPRQKIGVIDEAWIDGQDLKVRGHLFAKDFAGEVETLRAMSRTGELGMSFEITGVEIEDIDADLWTLRRAIFTGAAILQRRSAAYEDTRLIAAKREQEDMTMTMKAAQTVLDALDNLDAMRLNLKSIAATGEEAEKDDKVEAAGKDATVETKVAEAETKVEAGEDVSAADDEAMSAAMKRMSGMPMEKAMKMMKRLAGMQPQAARKAMANYGKKFAGAGVQAAEDEDVLSQIENDDLVEPSAVEEVVAAALAPVHETLNVMAEGFKKQQDIFAGLLTDMAQKVSGLLTDNPGGRALKTDSQGRPSDGGPVRKTLTASGEYENYIAKHLPGLDISAEADALTNAQIDEAFKNAGITDPVQRMGLKHYLEGQGKLR